MTSLRARAPLATVRASATLDEIDDLALVTIALPSEAVRARLADAFGVALPAMGASVIGTRGERLLGLQSDRLYILFPCDVDADPEATLLTRISTNGETLLYCSDQSDAWAMLRLDGPASRAVLERLCPLDLHADVFPVGAVARSLVEHLGVIVVREDENAFLLLSPRSSARDFLHEIETTLRHVGRPA